MGFILLSACLGLSAGAISAYSTKYFVGLLVSTLSFLSLVGTYYLGIISWAAMAQDITFLAMIMMIVDAAPDALTYALMLLPAFFFGARALAWFYKENIAEEVIESRDHKKYRLRREYGVSPDGTRVMDTAAR